MKPDDEKEFLYSILESLAEGVLTVNTEGVVTFLNTSAEKITGYRTSEIIGRECVDAFCPSDACPDDFPLMRTLKTHEPLVNRELSIKTSRGEALPVRASTAMLKNNAGGVLGAVQIFRDARKEREIEQIKSDIISIASHEFRTPLTAIKGYVDVIMSGQVGELTEVQRDFLNEVGESTNQLIHLVNRLLDLSRLESGRIEIRLESCQVEDFVGRAMQAHLSAAEEKNITLSCNIPENLPGVLADRSAMEGVIGNLLSNAINYTPSGSSVTVRAEERDDQIQISVSDTGIGIPEEYREKIFDRFYRVRNELTDEVGGTGLGLSIVKIIVDKHGSRPIVESEIGKGSTFSFSLQRDIQDANFLIWLDREMERAQANHTPLSLAILEIDNMSPVREQFGAEKAREISNQVKEMINQTVRGSDHVAEYKSDLVAVLCESDQDSAQLMAERITSLVQQHEFGTKDTPIRLEVSIGTATFPDDASCRNDLITMTEAALRKCQQQAVHN